MQPYPYPFVPWAWREQDLLMGNHPVDATQPADRAGADTPDDDARANADLAGYHVEALDGGIGSIDEANNEVGAAHLVVDTGPWIFGRKVLLPAGTVQRVDHVERKVYVDRTKDQIKSSPEYDESTFRTPEYREKVGTYYSDSYRDSPPAM